VVLDEGRRNERDRCVCDSSVVFNSTNLFMLYRSDVPRRTRDYKSVGKSQLFRRDVNLNRI